MMLKILQNAQVAKYRQNAYSGQLTAQERH
jgi:hypothetical protein